jgi:hypothetical protein
MIQRTDGFGPFHIFIEECNAEDEHIQSCMEHEESGDWERHLGGVLLSMTEDERISALAMAGNLWGCEPIPYDHPVTAIRESRLSQPHAFV